MHPPLPLVTVAGTPRECGVAYGAFAADLIAANTASYLARFPFDASLARHYGALFRRASHRYALRVADMLDGVAEGSGVDVDEIYALNGRTELIYGTEPHECTVMGVLAEGGRTLLGQNWDWHPAQRPYALLLSTTDELGHRALALTEAGMLAKAGLNDAGLGVCVNMLGSHRDRRDGGAPYHVLLRAALDARHLGAAIKAVCATPRGASINLLLGQAGDPGELIDLEVAPGDVGFLHPVDGVLTHANHFESALSSIDTLKSFGGSSFFRAARARRLLDRSEAGEAGIKRVLRDHLGRPQSICRHDEPDAAEIDRTESLYSLVMDLNERRMSIAAGPPCSADGYVDIWLDKTGRSGLAVQP